MHQLLERNAQRGGHHTAELQKRKRNMEPQDSTTPQVVLDLYAITGHAPNANIIDPRKLPRQVRRDAERMARAQIVGNLALAKRISQKMMARLLDGLAQEHGQQVLVDEADGIFAWLVQGAADGLKHGLEPPASLMRADLN